MFSHRTGNVKSFFSSHSHFYRCHVLDRCPLFWASARTLQRSRILCPPARRSECACKLALNLNAQWNFYFDMYVYVYTHIINVVTTYTWLPFVDITVKMSLASKIKYGDHQRNVLYELIPFPLYFKR